MDFYHQPHYIPTTTTSINSKFLFSIRRSFASVVVFSDAAVRPGLLLLWSPVPLLGHVCCCRPPKLLLGPACSIRRQQPCRQRIMFTSSETMMTVMLYCPPPFQCFNTPALSLALVSGYECVQRQYCLSNQVISRDTLATVQCAGDGNRGCHSLLNRFFLHDGEVRRVLTTLYYRRIRAHECDTTAPVHNKYMFCIIICCQ